ncbi:unnamed protein product [Closterium sp. NIES-54]
MREKVGQFEEEKRALQEAFEGLKRQQVEMEAASIPSASAAAPAAVAATNPAASAAAVESTVSSVDIATIGLPPVTIVRQFKTSTKMVKGLLTSVDLKGQYQSTCEELKKLQDLLDSAGETVRVGRDRGGSGDGSDRKGKY